VFIGRARELDELDRVLASANAGRGALRVVAGEPGIGKTRLADEVADRAAAAGFLVGWGRASETGGAPPYWPWIELLRALAESLVRESLSGGPAAVVSDVPPRMRTLLDGASRAHALGDGTSADPARERFELFDAVSSWLRASSRRTALLLIFDDLHTADVASLELLGYVASSLRMSRIAVVATYRDVEARRPPVAEPLARIARHGEVVALRALSKEDVAEVVRHETGRFDGALSTALFGLTEGNPLYLRETLHALAGGAQAFTVDAIRGLAVSGGVMTLVRSRLAGASERARELLDTAATIGREVPLPLLAEVATTTPDDARQLLADATTRGLLVRRDDERWVFSHVLVREAFYEHLAPERRRACHATIAAALRRRVDAGRDEVLAALAHHALASLAAGGAKHDAIEAMSIARQASDRARAQLAYEEAMALLERALAVCDTVGLDGHARAEVLLALGWARTEAGELARGREVFRDAAQIARRIGDARLLARAALGQGGEYVLAEIRGELLDVLREALTALKGSELEDVRLRARLLSRLGAALTPSETPAEPLALAREALAMTQGETDSRTRIDVGVAVGATLTDFAAPTERIAVNERLVQDARHASDRVLELRGLTRLACDHMERGDIPSAEAVMASRAALAESIGHPRYLWQAPLLRSMRAMTEGRFDVCEGSIDEARRLAAAAADPNAERNITVHRFWMLLVAGRPEPLRAHEPDTQRVMGSLPHGAMYRPWIAAAVRARCGDREAGARELRSIGSPVMLAARMSRATTTETALLCGVREWFEPLYESLIADGEDTNVAWGPFGFACAPPRARLLGELAFAFGRPQEGIHHCERALALSESMGARAHQAWVHLTWGEGLAGIGDPRARDHLQRAVAYAEEIGMPEIAVRGRTHLEEPRSVRPSTAPATAQPTFAMRREGEIWLFENQGRTFRLKDVRGLGMIARLVASPGREVHALDLAGDPASPEEGAVVDVGDAGEVIDSRARDAYRKRISDLRNELEEAERFADIGRAERLRSEIDALTEQLASAVGLGGRERRTGSSGERARITTQRRIREAIRRISDQDAELGRHLDWTVRTGTFCAYEPSGRKTGR
jgi:tetratricopeptide (TPR) repeat protein